MAPFDLASKEDIETDISERKEIPWSLEESDFRRTGLQNRKHKV